MGIYFGTCSRVMDDLTVKLTDYALARDLFPQDYDCLPTDDFNEHRPLKFMAIESILDRRFSTASDVVSHQPQLAFSQLHRLLPVVLRCSTLGIDESWSTAVCRYTCI